MCSSDLKDQLLQLVLVGQPELREKLRGDRLEQFVQRIGVDFHLAPLDAEDVDLYIKHRLRAAGGDVNIFRPAARRLVHYLCAGVPRRINSMCDTALVYGFSVSRKRITDDLVRDMVLERTKAGEFGDAVVCGLEGGSDEWIYSGFG